MADLKALRTVVRSGDRLADLMDAQTVEMKVQMMVDSTAAWMVEQWASLEVDK